MIFTPPVTVLLAVRTNVPGPDLVNPAVPAITSPIVTLLPSPSAPTVTVGVVPAKVMVLPLSVQLAGELTRFGIAENQVADRPQVDDVDRGIAGQIQGAEIGGVAGAVGHNSCRPN